MTYKHLKYVHDLALGRQSYLQRVRKLSVKVWHIPDSYNFVCGYNVPLEYENLKALNQYSLHSIPVCKLHK